MCYYLMLNFSCNNINFTKQNLKQSKNILSTPITYFRNLKVWIFICVFYIELYYYSCSSFYYCYPQRIIDFIFQEQIEKKKTQFSDGEDADDDDDETDETDDECESDASSMITSNSNSRWMKINFYQVLQSNFTTFVFIHFKQSFYQGSGCFSYWCSWFYLTVSDCY